LTEGRPVKDWSREVTRPNRPKRKHVEEHSTKSTEKQRARISDDAKKATNTKITMTTEKRSAYEE